MAYTLDLSFLDGLESTIEELDPRKLEIDPKIQRPLDVNKVRKIYNEFTQPGLNVLTVSRRTRPTQLIVVDGQHRWEAVLRRLADYGEPKLIRAEVFDKLTREQEALLFLTLNNGTKPRATDKYNVAVQAGEPVAAAIDQLLNAYGLKVSTFPIDGNVSAVDTLRRIYVTSEKMELEPNLLQVTLVTIAKAWEANSWSLKGMMFEAIAAIYREYKDLVNTGEFITKLSEKDPKQLVTDALHWSKVRGRTPAMALAEILVEVYNKGHRGDRYKLADWRRRKW